MARSWRRLFPAVLVNFAIETLWTVKQMACEQLWELCY